MPTNTELDNLAALTDRELDAVAAENVMGLKPCDKWTKQYGGWAMSVIGEVAHIKIGKCEHGDKCYPIGYAPNYSADYNLAFKLRRECERRGLQQRFAVELMIILFRDDDTEMSLRNLFAIASASARDITIAAIRACRVQKVETE